MFFSHTVQKPLTADVCIQSVHAAVPHFGSVPVPALLIQAVNNRDLKTFTVDISNSERLRKLVPENILFVAESGIKNNGDIKRLREAKVDAVLIGETFMKSENKKEMLKELAAM